MPLFLFVLVVTPIVGALAAAIRWLIDNDPNLGRALRFEIAPWQ